jgi:hypothetical protein
MQHLDWRLIGALAAAALAVVVAFAAAWYLVA